MTTITALPSAPTRADPDNFSAKGDALMTALVNVFVTETNTVATEINANAVSATASAGTATTQAGLATTNGQAQVTLAAAQVTLATTQAGLATTNGQAQVTLAAAQVTLATTQAGLATTNGAAQVSLATTQAGYSSTYANASSISAAAALASENAAATALDNLDDRWLGSKSSAPTLDNDGNALQEGATYWNNVGKASYTWNATAWVIQSFIPTAASGVAFTPSGGLVATNTQAALVELDTEKARLDGNTFTGSQIMTGSIVTVADQALNDNTSKAANTKFVAAELGAFLAATPYVYDSRDSLRTLIVANNKLAAIDGLGMFYYSSTSTETDDDETCFATATGRWLMIGMHPDYIDAHTLKQNSTTTVLPVFIRHPFTSTIATISANSESSMTFSVPGAKLGANVVITLPASLGFRALYLRSAYGSVQGDGVLTVVLVAGTNGDTSLAIAGYSALIINPF